VNVRAAKVVAFTVGAMLMSLGGSLYGHHYNYIEAQTFNVLLSIYILLYVLMGGTQTAWGPLLGAAFFVIVPEALRQIAEMAGLSWLAEGRFILFGVFIVLLMVFRSEGVMTRTLQDKIAGRLFSRCRSLDEEVNGR
jgi:branched-chain amino acid transport system permease protein